MFIFHVIPLGLQLLILSKHSIHLTVDHAVIALSSLVFLFSEYQCLNVVNHKLYKFIKLRILTFINWEIVIDIFDYIHTLACNVKQTILGYPFQYIEAIWWFYWQRWNGTNLWSNGQLSDKALYSYLRDCHEALSVYMSLLITFELIGKFLWNLIVIFYD